MASAKSESIDLSSGSFHYLAWGSPDNPPLILLHGFNQTAHSWSEVAPTLSADHRVIALTQRGHGLSMRAEDGDYSRKAMVDDADMFTKALGLGSFSLVGMSMGALHAMLLAATRPARVKRLVLVDWAPEIEKGGLDKIKWMVLRRWDSFDDAVAEVMQFNPRRTEENIRERLEQTLMQQPDGKWTWSVDPAFVIQPRFVETAGEVWKVVRGVKCPTLVIRGEKSDVLSGEMAERLCAELPDARLSVVADAGHSVPGDNPDGFVAAIRDFLSAASPSL